MLEGNEGFNKERFFFFFSQCVITMMMVKLPQSFCVMSVGICVQIVTDSFISIGEQKLIRDR